tara:strand:+ start:588 stop:803 length:216 start_codon:yes stop_codon:yes gene_type:complete
MPAFLLSPIYANSFVNDNLNAADMMFNAGMDGCINVSMAIMVANSPQIYGPTSSTLKSEIKTYARKCNLRF